MTSTVTFGLNWTDIDRATSAFCGLDTDCVSTLRSPMPQWGLLALSVIPVWIAGGNGLVLLALLLQRHLQNMSNRVIASLAVTDFLLALIVVPLSIYQLVLGHWQLGFYVCLAWTGSDVILSTASIMHLCAIALHRYHGIAHPLRMRSSGETRRVAVLVTPAWSIAVALSVPFVVQGILHRSYVLARLDPDGDGDKGEAQERLSCGIFNRTFAVYSSLVSFFLPLAVMIVADFRSVQILRKNIRFPVLVAAQASARRPRPQRHGSERSGDVDGEEDDGLRGRPTSLFASTTVQHAASPLDASSFVSVTSSELCSRRGTTPDDVQIRAGIESRANSVGGVTPIVSGDGGPGVERAQSSPSSAQSSFIYQGRSRSKSMVYLDMLASCGRSSKVSSRERRAEKTLIWVFAAFVALWLPFFCANLAYGACGGEDGPCDVPPQLFAVFTWLGYMSSGVNPCIYTLLNRDFRTAFCHLLMCRPSRLRSAGSTSVMSAAIRANSVRFVRSSGLNGSRRAPAARPTNDDDDGDICSVNVTKVVVTPSFP